MAKSPIKWVGGKNRLVKTLLPLFPEHRCYVEAFGGAGWMLFGKQPSKVEILNDFDSWLMNFWSVVKNAKDQLISSMEYTLVSRELFEEYKQRYKQNEAKDSIEKAKILFYLVNAGFASDLKNPSFGTKSQSRNGLRPEQIEQSINEAYKRLQKVTIENNSFEDIFRIYDKQDTFFFLDSPYRNKKQYAVGKFTDAQYEMLAECCKNAKGKWLYTINDDEFIRDLFKDFNIIDQEVYYSICKKDTGRKSFKELIITNYDV